MTRFRYVVGVATSLWVSNTLAHAFVSNARGGANAQKRTTQALQSTRYIPRWTPLLPHQEESLPNPQNDSVVDPIEIAALADKEEKDDEKQFRMSSSSDQKQGFLASAAKLDWSIFATYFCTCLGSTLPVILLPLMAADYTRNSAVMTSTSFIAGVASLSTIGGGIGKLVNGFVCQAMGGKWSGTLYLAAMSMCMVLLSVNTVASRVGFIIGGMDFCSSMLWTSCSQVFANHYDTGKRKNPIRYAQAMTFISLASTCGVLSGKFGGTLLLQCAPSWKMVAQFGAVVTMLGSLIMLTAIPDHPKWYIAEQQKQMQKQIKERHQVSSRPKAINFLWLIMASLRRVCGSSLFWIVGMAHACAYLARSSDRVLGAFFGDVSTLPKQMCGLLTASVTLGFMCGIQGKQGSIYNTDSTEDRISIMRRKYLTAVACMACLAIVACFGRLIPGALSATLGVAFSGLMAASLAVPFYQMPAAIASGYGVDRSVVTSLMDAFGFFLSSVVWKTTGKVVSSSQYGWSLAFLMVGGFYWISSYMMLNRYPEIKTRQEAV